jgi:hypothetical protein
MTRAEELLALAAKVEALSGPDRRVDGDIYCALGLAAFVEDAFDAYRAPAYTASLDAAMTVGGGNTTLLHLSELGDDNCALARVGCHLLPDAPVFEGRALEAAVCIDALADLAIATTAANLRALAALETGATA